MLTAPLNCLSQSKTFNLVRGFGMIVKRNPFYRTNVMIIFKIYRLFFIHFHTFKGVKYNYLKTSCLDVFFFAK